MIAQVCHRRRRCRSQDKSCRQSDDINIPDVVLRGENHLSFDSNSFNVDIRRTRAFFVAIFQLISLIAGNG